MLVHIIISVIVISVFFAGVRFGVIRRRPYEQVNNGTQPQTDRPDGEAYVKAVNTINYLIADIHNGHKSQFTAGDAMDLEVALQKLLGTQVEAQPMTSNEIILSVTLSDKRVRQLDITLVRTDNQNATILDNEKITAVEVNHTAVIDGQHFYAAIKHFLK